MPNALKLAALVRLLVVVAILGLISYSLSRADDEQSADLDSALVEETESPR